MKTIKFIFLVCVSVALAQCSSMKLTDKAPFEITGATYNNWVGGQPGVSGVNLIIGLKNEKNVEFSEVYFIKKKVKSYIETRKGKKYIIVNINTSSKTHDEKIIEEPKVKKEEKHLDFPFKLKDNEAVISYLIKGKIFYYKVSNIKKTETIFYP